jgi:hypothetical protein
MWAFLLTKKFQIGNFKFKMEATATAREAAGLESIGVSRLASEFGKIQQGPLTKKFQIGNFKFQMEERAKANPFGDTEVRASYARLSPGGPGKPGIGKAAASRRTPYGRCRAPSGRGTRDFDEF